MNEISAKCGHVKRRLTRDEPLSGKVLEFALEVVAEKVNPSNAAFLDEIARKFAVGEGLTEYEKHFMVDVLLLHKRLGAA